MELIAEVRRLQQRVGGRKIYADISDRLRLQGIKMGRDALFGFMREHRLLVRKTKQYHITTDSKHHYYKSPNRIKDTVPSCSEQVFVSDITYIKVNKEHAYLALVTDLYSKRIMGYKLDTNMRSKLVKDALKMALKNRRYPERELIHHSDRGIQYCCPEFTEYTRSKGILLSTTQQYDPYENAVAERVNGILKYEFGLKGNIPNLDTAHKMVDEAISIYNNKRRHCSLELQTPAYAHQNEQHQYKKYGLKV